jgi:hypothetical protein
VIRWLTGALLLAAAGHAYAAVQNDWSKTGLNEALTPAYNINITPGVRDLDPAYQTSFYALSNTLQGWRTQSNTSGGSYKVAPGAKIAKQPVVVKLGDGKWWAFFSSTDGRLHKVDAESLALATATVVDTKRGLGCVPDDSLVASPTVQISAFSSGQPLDLVMIPTFHGCGDHSLNQVIAYNAQSMSEVWRFNTFGEYQVDYFSEGCSLDYGRNLIYCGANLETGRTHNTLFAIHTTAGAWGAAGTLAWAVNSNPIRNRPQLGFVRTADAVEHLYVADHLGILHAYDPETGTERWQLPLTAAGVHVTQNVWSEFRDPYAMMVFVTDTAGDLHAAYDPWRAGAPEDGFEVWSRPHSGAVQIASLGSVAPTLGKLYAGFNNGTVHQITISNGIDEGSYSVSDTPLVGDIVLDPALHIQGGSEINKMIASSYGASASSYVKQFPVPFVAVSGTLVEPCLDALNPADPNLENPGCKDSGWYSPGSCKPINNDCCTVGRCHNGFCYAAIRPGGAPAGCNDGQGSCTINKKCKLGTCVGTWSYAICPGGGGSARCPSTRACGPGKRCYKGPSPQAAWECIDVSGGTPGSNGFSACGNITRTCDAINEPQPDAITWGGDRVCKNGRCLRDTGICGGIAKDTEIANAVDANGLGVTTWASGLTFERRKANGCRAFIPTYVSSKNNAVGPYLAGPYATQASPPNGCTVCGLPDGRLLAPGQTLNASFIDPLPNSTPRSKPTRIRVTVDGFVACGIGGTVNFSINNVPIATTTVGNAGFCTCNQCSGTILDVSSEVMGGWLETAMDWTAGGINTFQISTPMVGGAYLATAYVRLYVTGSNGENWVRIIDKNAMVTTLPSRSYPGYMHGIALAYRGTTAFEMFTTYINRPDPPYPHSNGGMATNLGALTEWVGVGRGVPTGGSRGMFGYDQGSHPFNISPGPRATSTGGKYPFLLEDYNFGPSSVTTDEDDNANSRLFFGNYRTVGDLYAVIKNGVTWSATPVGQLSSVLPTPGCAAVHSQADVLTARCVRAKDCPSDLPECVDSVCTKTCFGSGDCSGTNSPECKLSPAGGAGYCVSALCSTDFDCTGLPASTCTAGVCTQCDRVTATAYPSAINPASDQLLRVAVGPRIFFYDLSQNDLTPLKYWIDLNHPAQAGTFAGGSGSWSALGFRHIRAITSMTLDPLNLRGDLYLTAREERPAVVSCNGIYQDFVHVRGDDHAVRAVGVYTDEGCNVNVPGTMEELFPTGRIPQNIYKGDDLRITASSQQDLWTISPVDPTTGIAGAKAPIKAYDLLP